MALMKTIAEIRLENLRDLIEKQGSQERVASLAETSPVYLSQLLNRAPDRKTGKLRQIGDDMARKLEAGCQKEIGWMDNIHHAAVSGTTAPASFLVGEATPAYAISPKADQLTPKLLALWSRLDAAGKKDFLEKVDYFVAGRSPHAYGQALSVADAK